MGNEDMREFLDERTNGMGDPLQKRALSWSWQEQMGSKGQTLAL